MSYMCVCTYSIIVVVSVAVWVYVLLWCGSLRTVMPSTARPELNYSYKSINQAMHPCRARFMQPRASR